MRPTRRALLAGGIAAATGAVAGCSFASSSAQTDESAPTEETTRAAAEASGGNRAAIVDTAVAAEWNTMRASGRRIGARDRRRVRDGCRDRSGDRRAVREGDRRVRRPRGAGTDRRVGLCEAYIATLEDGGDVDAAAGTFADACQCAQFALVDAVEGLPLDLDLAGHGGSEGAESHGHGGDAELVGGPNVVDGVPDQADHVVDGIPDHADHVVDMTAVAFEPADLTVSQGDTVAWTYAGGEPHSGTADEDELPEGADYWASGGFDAQETAETGWENGEGAIQSGQASVRTFEATGTHGYYCIPHGAAGMTGTLTVE